MHRDIADFIAKGDGIGLDQYLKKSISILYPSWLPIAVLFGKYVQKHYMLMVRKYVFMVKKQ
jgi:hypothetical protein